jgi:hypothetical protein
VARITVEFVGPVRRPGPERMRSLKVEAALAVDALLERLGYGPEERACLTVLVDGVRQGPKFLVPDGARVEILLPVGGG